MGGYTRKAPRLDRRRRERERGKRRTWPPGARPALPVAPRRGVAGGPVPPSRLFCVAAQARLRPGETRQSLTERAAASFATVAQALRERGHDPQAVAHFVNRLVFCMFADDVGLLPNHMFTRMLEQARRTPGRFADLAGDLFRVMASGGRVGFETVEWFNGGLFDDDAALPLEQSDIDAVLAASNLDWSEIDPSLLGTLFERGLDPGKRAQLGAHYTDRDKIMLIVEPVVIRPWLAEWAAEKADIAAELERAEAAKSTRRPHEAAE